MTLFSTQVNARWDPARGFLPRSFLWQEREYQVESTGRQWEDDGGYHILCMVSGGAVFELVFRLQPAGWWLRPPSGPSQA